MPADLQRPSNASATDAPDATPVGGERPVSRRSRVSARRLVPVLLAGVLVVVIGGFVVVSRRDQPPPPLPDIPLDAWAPYWTLDDSISEVDQRARSMRTISPFWFAARGATDIGVDENASAELTDRFLDIVGGSSVDVVPTIVDAMPAGGMAAVLADPVTRRQHVDALVEFARAGDHDGIDLDYEKFAFSDDRSTWAQTRPDWVAFIADLGAALHADGRTLTVSVPPIYDTERTDQSGYWVYDHGAIAPHVDAIRIMAYDYSVPTAGPIAPLEWVETAIDGVVEATGTPDKVVLGIPAYGRNWVTSTTGTCPADAPGTTTVTARTVDELVATRGATPVFDEATGESSFTYQLELGDGATSCVQSRQVHYVDPLGFRQRMDLARQKQLGGVALWALGFDDQAVWDAILPTVTPS